MSEEYYLQPPLNRKFYVLIANLMTYFSVGNRLTWGYKKNPIIFNINRKIILYFAPVCVVSQLVYLYVNYSDLTFDILGIIFSILPATCTGTVNIYSSRLETFIKLSTDLLPKIHIYNMYKDDKSKFNKEIVLFVEKCIRLTSYYLIFFFIVSWLAWIAITGWNNIANRDLVLNHTMRLQTCIFLWMPFDYSYDYHRWFFIHVINCYAVFSGVCAIMIFQIINYIFIYNLIGHTFILKNKIKTEFDEKLSDKEVQVKLGKIIDYHIFICNVFKDVESAFGVNVAVYYFQNLLGNSIVLYQLMYGGRENMILYIVIVMAYTGGPIIMSFVLEEIRRQTWDLSEIAYEMPWQNMSVPNQKIVMLIIQRMQIIMDFKALGGLKAGVGPMISILKTTFSYYVMLETTMTK